MLLHPWDFPGKSTGMGCYFLLQRIFLTQGSNPGLLHCRQMLYPLSHRDPISIHGWGISPGEGNGNLLQYSCLENPRDGGAWWVTVHGVARSWTRLSDFTFTFTVSSYLCNSASKEVESSAQLEQILYWLLWGSRKTDHQIGQHPPPDPVTPTKPKGELATTKATCRQHQGFYSFIHKCLLCAYFR